MLMNRNLLYTAITRARRIVVLIGDPEVMNDMIDNTSETKRYTGLDLYMRESALDTQEPEDFNPGWIDPDDPFAGLD